VLRNQEIPLSEKPMPDYSTTALLWVKSNNISSNVSADISAHAYLLLNNCKCNNFTIKRFYTMLSTICGEDTDT
jgi:hypothetical protein